MTNTLTHWQVASFTTSFVNSGAGDLVDALKHLQAETGIGLQSLLWLNSGKAQSVTVLRPFSL